MVGFGLVIVIVTDVLPPSGAESEPSDRVAVGAVAVAGTTSVALATFTGEVPFVGTDTQLDTV